MFISDCNCAKLVRTSHCSQKNGMFMFSTNHCVRAGDLVNMSVWNCEGFWWVKKKHGQKKHIEKSFFFVESSMLFCFGHVIQTLWKDTITLLIMSHDSLDVFTMCDMLIRIVIKSLAISDFLSPNLHILFSQLSFLVF